MLADKEKAAENTLVFSRALTQYEGISARQNRMFSCLSMANSARKRASAAASRIFSKRSLAKQGSFLMYQHHSRLWGLFFTGGV